MPSLREAKLRHAQYYDEMATQQSQKQADYTWIDKELGQLEQVQNQLGTHSDPTSAELLVKITETIAFSLFNYGQRGQMLEWCDRALHIADQVQHNPGSLLKLSLSATCALSTAVAAIISRSLRMVVRRSIALIQVCADFEPGIGHADAEQNTRHVEQLRLRLQACQFVGE